MPRNRERRLSTSSGDGGGGSVAAPPPLPANLGDYDVFLVRRARTGDNFANQLAPGVLRYGETTIRAPKVHECHWIDYATVTAATSEQRAMQALVYPARKHTGGANAATDATPICTVNAMVTLMRHKAKKTDTLDKTAGSNLQDNRRPLPQPPSGVRLEQRYQPFGCVKQRRDVKTMKKNRRRSSFSNHKVVVL